MAIRIGNEVLESAEGSATFNGTSLTRIKYYNDIVWDKGVDMTMISGLNLIITSCGTCEGDEGYVCARMADSINGHNITPSYVCFSNVANSYTFGINTIAVVCGHVKIGDNWYEIEGENRSISSRLEPVYNTCSISVNLEHRFTAHKSQCTYDSDELGLQECYLLVRNRTTNRQYKLPWQQGQTYCV